MNSTKLAACRYLQSRPYSQGFKILILGRPDCQSGLAERGFIPQVQNNDCIISFSCMMQSWCQ